MRILFATQSYRSDSLPLSAQRCVNFYMETAPPDAKTQTPLLGVPGISLFGTAGTGPVRGLHVMADVLYAVSGSTLYSVSPLGVVTDLGDIDVNGRVVMADNGTQLCIATGTKGYIYTVSGGLVEITSDAFYPTSSVAFQDGYFIFVRDGTQQFFISNILDGTTYDGDDFASAESSPDNLVAVASHYRELWLFGAETTEVWYNSGAADFPFARNPGVYIERGCGARHSVAQDDNTLFWLGNDRLIYRAEERIPRRISTYAIEQALEKYQSVANAFAFTYTYRGHKFYTLTLPNQTWVYDISTGLWHERKSGVEEFSSWRASCYQFAYGKHIVGDSLSGKIGILDAEKFDEFGNVLQGYITSPPIHSDRKRLFMSSFELDMETGVGPLNGLDPQYMLEYSDDGGRSFKTRQDFRSAGKMGEYLTRVRWTRLGSFRDRIFRLTISDPVRRTILGAHADIEMGTS